MGWTLLDTWIVVTGALCAMACAILGNFLVLRKMSMMGDAISHAVLPGLAMAFLYTGTRGSWAMFVGAALVGVLTALLTQGLSRYGRVDEGASMGVVFTILFAIGLIMIVRGADAVDLDPNCVLYGAIEMTPLDQVRWAGLRMPRAVWMLATMLVVNGLFVTVFYKELLVTSFDDTLAAAMGFRPVWMHYALMTLVAVTAVAAFESVGSILVIAMLIVPGATAFLFSHSLRIMILISLVVAVISAVGGHLLAITVPQLWGYSDTTTAGMMAVVAGLCFGIAFFMAPGEGVLNKRWQRRRMAQQIIRDDVLGFLYRLNELHPESHGKVGVRILQDALCIAPSSRRRALRELVRGKQIDVAGSQVRPTAAGLVAGRDLIRSHRLWESYLHTYLNIPTAHVHGPAEKLEHLTDPAIQHELAKRTGSPRRDPQGRAIP